MNRGPVAEIDLSALQHNLSIVSRIADKRTVIAVVKADAYGHGSVEISRKLQAEGVNCLAVAYTGEAITLREAGIDAKIIVLFDRTDPSDYFDHNLIPVIQDLKTAQEFSREALARGTRLPVHLKIDTGMGRVGFNSEQAFSEVLKISELKGLSLEGLMSHFSGADLSDRSFAFHQVEVFETIMSGVSERIGRRPMAHMANSAAVLSMKEALFDAVRPGIVLYGSSPFGDDYGLLPVMKIRTRVLVVRRMPEGCPVSYGRTFVTKRESRIAVIPVGYADGYSRSFSSNAEVLVKGRRAPVVGRVCMDLAMVDVTEIDGVSEGDEVVLLGGQGEEAITAAELASRINTISYDILTSLGSRARREYIP